MSNNLSRLFPENLEEPRGQHWRRRQKAQGVHLRQPFGYRFAAVQGDHALTWAL